MCCLLLCLTAAALLHSSQQARTRLERCAEMGRVPVAPRYTVAKGTGETLPGSRSHAPPLAAPSFTFAFRAGVCPAPLVANGTSSYRGRRTEAGSGVVGLSVSRHDRVRGHRPRFRTVGPAASAAAYGLTAEFSRCRRFFENRRRAPAAPWNLGRMTVACSRGPANPFPYFRGTETSVPRTLIGECCSRLPLRNRHTLLITLDL